MPWWGWLLLGIGAITMLYLIGSALLALYFVNKANRFIDNNKVDWNDNWPNL